MTVTIIGSTKAHTAKPISLEYLEGGVRKIKVKVLPSQTEATATTFTSKGWQIPKSSLKSKKSA